VDSLKGGITEKCDCMGNPAKKWLAYSTLKSIVLGELIEKISGGVEVEDWHTLTGMITGVAFGNDTNSLRKPTSIQWVARSAG
jgi:hypothetical protein